MKATGKIILALTLVLVSFSSNAQEKEKATSTNLNKSAAVKAEYKRLQAPSKKSIIKNKSKIVRPVKIEIPARNTINE